MAFLRVILACSIEAVQSQGSDNPFIFKEGAKEVKGRIIQGWPAADTQFPHQVYLKNAIGYFCCGGALISPRWVLTAADCIDGKSRIDVHLGEINQSKPGLEIRAKRIFTHPRANIGLIDLGEEVELSDKIRPIRLPTKDVGNLVGETATASGWGFTKWDDDPPNALQYVNLTIISNTKCAKNYSIQKIDDAVVCAVGATNPAQASCSGDTGSPLTYYGDNGTPTLVGISSFFRNVQCDPPSGYVRPQFYFDWINNTMAS